MTKEEVLRITGGNPLYLRELVLGGLESGALRQVDKVWRWRGKLADATRLAELVQGRLSTLDETARVAVELVAWGEPLGVGVLERLVGKDAVQTAEDGGLLVLERSGRRTLARLAHPLYGEVLRATLPLSRARAVAERLAADFGAGALRRRDDLLRVGAWQLEAGMATNPDLLLEAARQAAGRLDHELTERLARAAVDAGGGPTAVRVLAETLEWQGRHAEAVAVMDGEPPAQGAERARWASIRAGNLYWGLERTAEAEEVLQQAAVGEEGGEEAVAMLAWILLFDGRLPEAVAVAGRILDRPEAPAQALVWAATAAVPALGSLGRLGEALAVADRGLAVAEVHPQDLPWGETQLNLVRCQVLLGAGRLAEASAIADAGYQAAVADRSSERTGVGPASGAWSPRPRAGSRPPRRGCGRRSPCWMSRIPIGSCAGVWPSWRAWRPWPAIRRRRWAGWSARTPAPERPTATLIPGWSWTRHGWPPVRVSSPEPSPSRPGRRTWPGPPSSSPSRRPPCTTWPAWAPPPPSGSGWRSWLACWRVGWRRCWPARRSRWPPTMGRPLDRVGAAFEDLGSLLLAAEAKAAAARAHRAAGREASANASQERAAALVAACQGARTPGLGPAMPVSVLTPREREVAMLAAAQASSREIATRLHLSVRTVDNYLGRVYAKLGVSSRARLATLLEVRASR